MWRVIVQCAPLSEAPGQVLLDYVLSGVNLGLGVFLVWRRPLDGVARLLGLAMVGTAAAFNLQAHTAFATVDTVAAELHAIVPIHWVLHAVSGAAYLPRCTATWRCPTRTNADELGLSCGRSRWDLA